MYKKLRTNTQVFSFPEINKLAAWLVSEAAQRKCELDVLVAKEMITRLGFDRWQLLSELEKFSLTSKTITVDLVRSSLPVSNVEVGIFTMLDSLSSGNMVRAAQAMEAILQSGASELYVLSMMAYQFKTLLQVKRGVVQGLSADQIAKKEGLHPFVVKKNSLVVTRYSVPVLLGHLTRIMATDFAIKQGKVDQRTALIMLLNNLAGQPKKIPT